MKAFEMKDLLVRDNPEPKPDIAICQECDWKGKVTDCELDQESSWESGYYTIHICPECEDGGVIEYDMSPEQLAKWEEWRKGGNK